MEWPSFHGTYGVAKKEFAQRRKVRRGRRDPLILPPGRIANPKPSAISAPSAALREPDPVPAAMLLRQEMADASLSRASNRKWGCCPENSRLTVPDLARERPVRDNETGVRVRLLAVSGQGH